jgi:hypothetical protein
VIPEAARSERGITPRVSRYARASPAEKPSGGGRLADLPLEAVELPLERCARALGLRFLTGVWRTAPFARDQDQRQHPGRPGPPGRLRGGEPAEKLGSEWVSSVRGLGYRLEE